MESSDKLRNNKTYIPREELYRSLTATTQILDEIGVRYVLMGGTLLGLVREGKIIDDDTDWDVDILDTDLDKVMAVKDRFLEQGLIVQKTMEEQVLSFDVRTLAPGEKRRKIIDRKLVKVGNTERRMLGDLFTYTLFSDGIMRPYQADQKAALNPKLSYPYWFFENRVQAEMQGVKYWIPAAPEMYLERQFGPDWRIPLKRFSKDRKAGLNHAGAVDLANINMLIKYALDQGWSPYQEGAPDWPQPVEFVNNQKARRWIRQFEDLKPTPEHVSGPAHFAYKLTESRLRWHEQGRDNIKAKRLFRSSLNSVIDEVKAAQMNEDVRRQLLTRIRKIKADGVMFFDD